MCQSTNTMKNNDIKARIKSEIASLPDLKAKFEEAKARFQASPYTDAVECSECGGSGRYTVSYCVGYDEYDYDTELCDHCIMCGVYAWDVNRSWFNEEATKAELLQELSSMPLTNLDEEEFEEAMEDRLRDQAYDLDMEAPQVIKDYQSAYYDYTSVPYGIAQDLDMLQYFCEEDGYGDIEKDWLTSAIEEVDEIIESMKTIKL